MDLPHVPPKPPPPWYSSSSSSSCDSLSRKDQQQQWYAFAAKNEDESQPFALSAFSLPNRSGGESNDSARAAVRSSISNHLHHNHQHHYPEDRKEPPSSCSDFDPPHYYHRFKSPPFHDTVADGLPGLEESSGSGDSRSNSPSSHSEDVFIQEGVGFTAPKSKVKGYEFEEHHDYFERHDGYNQDFDPYYNTSNLNHYYLSSPYPTSSSSRVFGIKDEYGDDVGGDFHCSRYSRSPPSAVSCRRPSYSHHHDHNHGDPSYSKYPPHSSHFPLPFTKQRAPSTYIPKDQTVMKGKTMIEISPGVSAELRGSEETWEAILSDCYMPSICFCCTAQIFAIDDCGFVLCPSCRVVFPSSEDDDRPMIDRVASGVGLGFTYDDLIKWQPDIEQYHCQQRLQYLQQHQQQQEKHHHQKHHYLYEKQQQQQHTSHSKCNINNGPGTQYARASQNRSYPQY